MRVAPPVLGAAPSAGGPRRRARGLTWRPIGLAALIVLAAGPDARGDVADYLGRPIASVRLEIEGRRADDRKLLDVLETRVGEPLAMRAVRETVAHLFAFGRFEDLAVHASEVATGVALLFALTPAHPVEQFAFTGIAGVAAIDQGRLSAALRERFGSSPPAARAPEMTVFVEEQLRARGHLHPRVTSTIQLRHAPDRAVLVFAIEPGVRTRIRSLDVVGRPNLAPRALLSRLGLSSGDPYEPESFGARIEGYMASRRREGHFEARLSVTARFEDDDRVADLTLTAIDGPLVRVNFKGDPLSDDRRETLVPIASEGSANEDLLEDSSLRIEEYLRSQGYRDARAPYSREELNGELLITFTVNRGPLYLLARPVEIVGNVSVPMADLEARLRLRPGQLFRDAILDGDVSAIDDVYRLRGFTAVNVRADVEGSPQTVAGEDHVLVTARVLITENVRTVVGSVRVEGSTAVPESALFEGVGLRPGEPFFPTQMAIDRDAIQLQYANLGYQYASVESIPELSPDGTRADVVFLVNQGPRLFVDHVLIVGNVRTRAETIERELLVKAGDPLGLATLVESQRRLAALGLFRRTRLTQLDHGDATTRDLLVTVEEAPATTIGYGGGVEFGQRIAEQDSGAAATRLELAPRAFFEISRRNLFGKNRSVTVFTRVSLRPADQSAANGADGAGLRLSEYRVLGTFREPRVFGTPADAFLTGTAEQQLRSSFNFVRRALTAEAVRAVTRQISLSGNYQIQWTELLDEKLNEADKRLIDKVFPQVLLSSFSAAAVRDTRDDQLNPAAGFYLSANAQLAARRIGSEVGLVKSYLTAQLFRRFTNVGRVVFAASARLGLAAGFPREVPRLDSDRQPVIGADGEPVVDVVKDLPASERFFAGGDTTVRGFARDQLGTSATIDQDGFPIGGNALAIFNAELRLPVRGGLGVVGFLDSGNVFALTTDLDLGQLRSALGFGVRYASPVGPIRVDLGFKANRQGREGLTALHISLGQAF